MWNEIAIMSSRLDELLKKAMYLERVATQVMELAHDIAHDADILKYQIDTLRKRYDDDLK